MITSSPVRVAVRRVADLSPDDWAEIREFASRYFEGAFMAGIEARRELVQLRGGDGRLLGIGAFETFDVSHEGRTITVLDTGNAAFAPQTRGHGYLHRIGFRYFLRAKRRHPWRPVYVAFGTFSWRSYLSLTRNFRCFWPRHGTPTPHREAGLLALLGPRLLGDRYDPAAGVGRDVDRRLRPDIAAIPHHVAGDPDVGYFALRNAGYARGDVMLCLAPLNLSNWLSAAGRIVRRWARGRARRAAHGSHPRPTGLRRSTGADRAAGW